MLWWQGRDILPPSSRAIPQLGAQGWGFLMEIPLWKHHLCLFMQVPGAGISPAPPAHPSSAQSEFGALFLPFWGTLGCPVHVEMDQPPVRSWVWWFFLGLPKGEGIWGLIQLLQSFCALPGPGGLCNTRH